MQVGGVDHIDDYIRFAVEESPSGDELVVGDGAERIGSRQVDEADHRLTMPRSSEVKSNGLPWIIGGDDIETCELVEEARFSNVRVTG